MSLLGRHTRALTVSNMNNIFRRTLTRVRRPLYHVHQNSQVSTHIANHSRRSRRRRFFSTVPLQPSSSPSTTHGFFDPRPTPTLILADQANLSAIVEHISSYGIIGLSICPELKNLAFATTERVYVFDITETIPLEVIAIIRNKEMIKVLSRSNMLNERLKRAGSAINLTKHGFFCPTLVPALPFWQDIFLTLYNQSEYSSNLQQPAVPLLTTQLHTAQHAWSCLDRYLCAGEFSKVFQERFSVTSMLYYPNQLAPFHHAIHREAAKEPEQLEPESDPTVSSVSDPDTSDTNPNNPENSDPTTTKNQDNLSISSSVPPSPVAELKKWQSRAKHHFLIDKPFIEELEPYDYPTGEIIVASTNSEWIEGCHQLRKALAKEKREAPVPSEYQPIMGFDTEWSLGRAPAMVLIQLATKDLCVLFRFHRNLRSKLKVPRVLRELLLDPDVLKVAQDIAGDWRMIQKRFPDCFPDQGLVPGLYDLMWLSEAVRCYPAGLRAMCAGLLGSQMNKAQQCSDWSKNGLTEAQIKYASYDAFVSRQLYIQLHTAIKELNQNTTTFLESLPLPEDKTSKVYVTLPDPSGRLAKRSRELQNALVKKKNKIQEQQEQFAAIFQGKLRVTPTQAIHRFCTRFNIKQPKHTQFRVSDKGHGNSDVNENEESDFVISLSLELAPSFWIHREPEQFTKSAVSPDHVIIKAEKTRNDRMLRVTVSVTAADSKLALHETYFRLLSLLAQTRPVFPLLSLPAELVHLHPGAEAHRNFN